MIQALEEMDKHLTAWRQRAEDAEAIVNTLLNAKQVQPNSLIVVHVNKPEAMDLNDMKHAFARFSQRFNVSFLFADAEQVNFEVLDEDMMRQAGWVRNDVFN